MTNLSMDQISRAESLHNQAVVFDGHSDWSIEMARWRLKGESNVIKKRHLPSLKAGGVSVEVLTVGGDVQVGPLWGPLPLNVLKILDMVHQEIKESSGDLILGKKAEDVSKAKASGKVALFLALEGLRPIEDSLALLRTYWRLGVRMVGLTWNGRNEIADGCGEREPAGLSNFGRDVVAEAEKLGMLIDLSHLSENSFRDVMEVTKETLIASHSNARGLCNHNRNLRDEQLKQIAERGGTVGINFFPGFIHRTEKVFERLLDHIDYAAKLVGPKHVVLGPDFTEYIDDYLAESSLKMESQGIALDAQYRFYKEIDDVSKLPNVTKGLVARGYSDSEIKGILGENLLRVYERVFDY